MKGVILAAGKGTRLYPATTHIPKPLLPIANRPTIHYAFDRLREIDVTEICVVVGENEEAMRRALGTGEDQSVRLTFVRQSEPKGLAHAISFAKDFVGGDESIVYLGDAIYSEPLSELRTQFSNASCANLNLVKEVDDPRRFGVANVEGGKIVKLVEKPAEPESNLAMAGVYFFRSPIWDVLPDLQPSARSEYEITDAIQLLIDRGETVLPGLYEGDWFDTGTLDSFLECTRYLIGGGVLVGASALVNCPLGASTCIGEGSLVECGGISDSTILPGSKVQVSGRIEHCILGGNINLQGDLKNCVAFDGELIEY
jgi:glucose-1-phosphate thymidylyltransferase